MKAFFIILNFLLTASRAWASGFTVNDYPIEMLAGGRSGIRNGSIFRINFNPEVDHPMSHTVYMGRGSNILALGFEGNNLINQWAKIAQESTKEFRNQGGLIGTDSFNPVFTGARFSFNGTSLVCENSFSFRAEEGLPSVIRAVHFTKLPGFTTYPSLEGVIDFTKFYSGVLTSVGDGGGGVFLVRGARVSLELDGSKLKGLPMLKNRVTALCAPQ